MDAHRELLDVDVAATARRRRLPDAGSCGPPGVGVTPGGFDIEVAGCVDVATQPVGRQIVRLTKHSHLAVSLLHRLPWQFSIWRHPGSQNPTLAGAFSCLGSTPRLIRVKFDSRAKNGPGIDL